MKKALKHLKYIKSTRLGARIAKGFIKGMVLKKPVLRSVVLAITYDCNAKCDMCYSRDLLDKGRVNLGIGQIKGIWDQAHELGAVHVNITGGEPLLRKDICDIIRVLRPKSTLVSIVTNASLIDEEKMKKLKEAGLSYLQISLDSIDPKKHDGLRKIPGLYNKVINAVELCKKYGISCCFSAVVYHGGIDDFEEIVKLAKKYDIMVLMNYVGIVGGWKTAEELALTKDDFARVYKLMKDPNVRFHTMYNFSGKLECPAGKEKLYITAYGDVMACNKNQIKSFGNVLKEPLKKIWDRMYNNQEFSSYCKDCKRFNL